MGFNITPSVAANATEQAGEKIADDIEVLPGGTVIDNPQDVAWLRSYYELSSITAKFAEQFMDARGDEAVRALMGRHRATSISPGTGLEPVSTTPTTAPDITPFGQGIADIASEQWLRAALCFPVRVHEANYRRWCREAIRDQDAGRRPRFQCRKTGKHLECIKPSVDAFLISMGIAPK